MQENKAKHHGEKPALKVHDSENVLSDRPLGQADLELSKLKKSLVSSEARFRLVFDEAIEGILIADINTKRFVMANSALCMLLGYSKDEILKLGIHDIHPQENLPQVLDQFMELALGKTKIAESIPCLRKDGTIIFADISASVLRLDKRPCLVGFFRDVTGKIEAQQKILESEKRFKSLAERSVDAIFSTDALGIINYMSPSFEKMSGFRVADVLGKRFDQFLEDDEKNRANKIFEVTTKTRRINRNLQFKILKKDGGFFWGEVSGHPIMEEGLLVGTEGSVHDITHQKKTEEEILRLKEFNERIVKNSPTGIVTTDIDGNITSVNPAVLKILGSPSERKTRQFNVLTFGPLVKQGISVFFKNCLTRGKTVTAYGIPYTSFWGKATFISLRIVPFFDDTGLQVGSIALIEDVTRKKRDEIKIQEAEDRFKAAFRYAPAGMALVGPNERFLSVNSRLCSMLGYSSEELLHLKYTDLIHPGEIAESKMRIRKMVKGYPHVVGAEKRFVHKNGSIVWGIVNAFAVRGIQPRDDYAVIHVLDITERKRSETELLLKNALLDAQKEASIEGMLAVDSFGKVISRNRRFEEMWGIPHSLIQTGDDQKILKFVTSQLKHPKEFISLVKRLYGNTEKRLQDLIEFNDGRVFSRYTTPLNDSRGNCLGRIWFFRDITHEIEVDRAKSEFITIASHQLRTPLTATKWLLQAILRRGHLTNFQAEFIRKAVSANDRMIMLANDLLDISSLESGATQPVPLRIDLVHLLERLVDTSLDLAKSKNQQILFQKPSARAMVLADPKLIGQAISNILSNSIQYSDKGKKIHVSILPVEEGYDIRIRDEGIGFTKADQKHLFEQFFRGAKAKKYSTVGSGLGLSMAKKVLSLIGGSIRLRSKSGHGTTITIFIPHHPLPSQRNQSKKVINP